MSAADALNPRQHKDYIYTHAQDESSYGTRFDDYKLIKRTTNELGDVRHEQVGNLTVNRYRAEKEFVGLSPREMGGGAEYDEDWYRDTATSTAVKQTVQHPRLGAYQQPVGRQGRLFEYMPPVAGVHKVDVLTGTRENRAANMVMLGMAENAARSEGTSLKPSEDLSEHSSRLVKHLKGTGAVSEKAETGVTNEMQFSDAWSIGSHAVAPSLHVPKEQVEAGRKTVRQVVKGGKPSKMKGQGTLF